jgi:hypothetical protein
MGSVGDVMGWMMSGMMAYWALISILVLVVLMLLAVWLFQQVRRGGRSVA